jgi:hypothetical protein
MNRAIDQLHRETRDNGDRAGDAVARAADKLRLKIGTLPTDQCARMKKNRRRFDERVSLGGVTNINRLKANPAVTQPGVDLISDVLPFGRKQACQLAVFSGKLPRGGKK